MKKILLILSLLLTAGCDTSSSEMITDSAYALECQAVGTLTERCTNAEVVCYVWHGAGGGTPFCKFKTK